MKWLLVFALTGCAADPSAMLSDDDSETPRTEDVPDMASRTEAENADLAMPPLPTEITLAATNGKLPKGIGISIAGTGSSFIGAIAIDKQVGTIDVQGVSA